jgi:hypothetical protein
MPGRSGLSDAGQPSRPKRWLKRTSHHLTPGPAGPAHPAMAAPPCYHADLENARLSIRPVPVPALSQDAVIAFVLPILRGSLVTRPVRC